MNFTVSSKTLYNLASSVGKVINSKNVITVLNNFLVSLEGNKLTLVGSDVENTLAGTIEVSEAKGEGKFLIDSKRLTSLLKEMNEQPLNISFDDESYEIEVKSNTGRYSLVGYNAEMYPQLKDIEEPNDSVQTIQCKGQLMIDGLKKTISAVSTDTLMPAFTGIFVAAKEGIATFVATDTRMLVKYEKALENSDSNANGIISSKAAGLIIDFIKANDDVEFNLTSQRGKISNDDFTLTFTLVQGKYPDYNRVIPKNNNNELIVNRQEIINAVRRINSFSDAEMGLIKANFTEDKILMNSSNANLLTQADETLLCEYTGTSQTIGLSSQYLLKACSSIECEKIRCFIDSSQTPLLFHPYDSEEENHTIVLMPMSIPS